MKIESQSKNLNPSGLEIHEGWSTRAANAGVSFRKVCEEAEEILHQVEGFHIKSGSIYMMANIWRYQPPAAILLLHELYLRILVSFPMSSESLPQAFALLCDIVEKRINFSAPIPAIRYYLAIEQALLWAEEEVRK